MPEGDTVWHTAENLRRALVGRTLTRCDIRVPRFATVDLTGQVVDEVCSRGKHLFIRVGPASVHSHLKMDGSWRVGNRPARVNHRARIILEANDICAVGIDLGVLEILDRPHDGDVVAHLGPDLLGDDWDPQVATANLTTDPARPIAETLLDQRVLAAADPANPYGAALPWPSRTADGDVSARPGRKAGALVVLVDGELAWFLERGGRSLLSFRDEPELNHAAAAALAELVGLGRVSSILVERINGVGVLGAEVSAPAVAALSDAGFARTPRGLRLR